LRLRSAYLAIAILSCLAIPATAQDAPWTIGNGDIKMSGLIDSYYSYNFNNPASGYNTLRNFEVKSRQFSLNMAEFSLYQDADPIGFRVDLGFGRAWDVFHATEPGDRSIQRFIPQAYITAKKGSVTFDFGKFYTSVGAELTENNYTWHYGRGYMYTNGPYYHMGLRINKAFGEQWTLGFQLVNGWNNVEDNNSGKTMGFTSSYTTKSKKYSWLTASYVGPEKTGTNKGWKNIYDTVINFSPTDKWTGYFDYYHGWENLSVVGSNGNLRAANWDAFGLSSNFNVQGNNFVAFRYEYYGDHDGWATGYGQQIRLQEFTATYTYKWAKGLKMLWEWRHDMANKGFYEKGSLGQPLNPGIGDFIPGPAKHQDTITVGFVAFFGGK
jgi:hypothetical protein